MNNRHRTSLVRQGFSLVSLSAILVLSALGLSRCRMVNDTVTGVNVESNATFAGGKSACQKACNENFKTCQTAEEQRHKTAKDRCKQLPSKHRKECEKAESQRHKQEKKACRERKKACQKACNYREGSGSAGF